MKINPVMAIAALAISALVAYGFFAWNSGEQYRLLITIGGGIAMFLTLGGMLALGSKDSGTAVNLKVLSLVFFIVLLIEHVIFSFAAVAPAPYIIITGILVLIYIAIAYGIRKALK